MVINLIKIVRLETLSQLTLIASFYFHAPVYELDQNGFRVRYAILFLTHLFFKTSIR